MDFMKKINFIISALASMTLLVCSCHKETVSPALSFESTEITVPGTGGKIEIKYTLSNPSGDAQWSYECNEEWISGYDFSNDGIIVLNVEPNYVESPREASITFYYSAIDQTFDISIMQEAGSPQMPCITFEPSSVEVSGKGGEVSVKYNISNPVAGERIEGSTDAKWISGIDTSVEGIITFNVSLNYTEQTRTTEISFSYADMLFPLTVSQTEGNPDDAFTLTITETTPITATIKTVPADSVMTYTVIPADKSYFESYSSTDEFILQTIENYKAIAGIAGMQFEEFMQSQILAVRTCYWTKDQLIPGTEYIFLVVGMEPDGSLTTKAFIEEFSTPQPEMTDIDFTLEVVPDEQSAIVTTTPSRDDIQYYTEVKLLSDMPAGENMTATDFQDWVNMKIWMGSTSGKSPQEVISEIVTTGKQVKEYYNLTSDTEYVAFTGAVDPNGVVISECEAIVFKTKKLSDSQNTFNVTITEEVDAIVVDVVPSVQEDQYTVVIAELPDCEGKTDEEYATEQASYLGSWMNARIGSATIRIETLNMLWKLCSDTEYKLFIFGMEESKVTTPVTSYYVKTLPAEDPATFTADLSISEVTPTNARLDITVNQQTTLYLAGFVPVDFTSEQTIERINVYADRLIEKTVVDNLPRFMGYAGFRGDINDGSPFYMIDEYGYQAYLEAGKQYKPYAVAVNDKTAEYASVIFGEPFTTSASDYSSVQRRISDKKIPYLQKVQSNQNISDSPNGDTSDLLYRLGKYIPTKKLAQSK